MRLWGEAQRSWAGLSPLPQVVPDGRLVQALTLVQEAGNLLRCVLQKFILHQELDPLVGGGQVSVLMCSESHLPPSPWKPQHANHPHTQYGRTRCHFQASHRYLNTIPPTS